MSYIFEVKSSNVKGIIEVFESDSDKAIHVVNKMGLKYTSMRPSICIYHIQYTMKHNYWKL